MQASRTNSITLELGVCFPVDISEAEKQKENVVSAVLAEMEHIRPGYSGDVKAWYDLTKGVLVVNLSLLGLDAVAGATPELVERQLLQYLAKPSLQ